LEGRKGDKDCDQLKYNIVHWIW